MLDMSKRSLLKKFSLLSDEVTQPRCFEANGKKGFEKCSVIYPMVPKALVA